MEKISADNREPVYIWGGISFLKLCDANNIVYSKEITLTSSPEYVAKTCKCHNFKFSIFIMECLITNGVGYFSLMVLFAPILHGSLTAHPPAHITVERNIFLAVIVRMFILSVWVPRLLCCRVPTVSSQF